MIKVGDSAVITNTVTEDKIILFAQASGDHNPLHLNEDYANKSIFRKRVAHGMLSASFISAVLGTTLPGEGSIYLSQTLKFIKPVYINDTITTEVSVVSISNSIALLHTTCKNQEMQIVTKGEAKVLLPNKG